MFSKSDIIRWNKEYNDATYPFGLYEDLVIKGKHHKRKIELMGAWKTGSIRIKPDGKEYKDESGNKYGFTNRWKPEAPVAYHSWRRISKNYCEILNRIPESFPIASTPAIIDELVSYSGIGFIHAVFVLHCTYPTIYPLYDQHVYRAYMSLIGKDFSRVYQSPQNWEDYRKYSEFFKQIVERSGMSYWIVDRAMWAYGKSLNPKKKDKTKPKAKKLNRIVSQTKKGLIQAHTLGKGNVFWWAIDPEGNITIERKFKNESTESTIIRNIEVNKIFEYVEEEWVSLANNVEKLRKGTEKEGIGKFMYEVLRWNETDCQLSGHLGAIFTKTGVWDHNGMKRGIMFRRKLPYWKESLLDFIKPTQ